MAYEYKYRQHEIPEIDSFIEDYVAVCAKHGMQFQIYEYNDGGACITLDAGSGELPGYLNLDHIHKDLPFVKRLDADVEADRVRTQEARLKIDAAKQEESDVREFERLKRKFGQQ